jgi:hypothetical protein
MYRTFKKPFCGQCLYVCIYIYIYTVLMHKRHWPQKKKNIYMYMPINTVVSTVGLILPMLNKLINYFKSV